jgi:hypothetical protein
MWGTIVGQVTIMAPYLAKISAKSGIRAFDEPL